MKLTSTHHPILVDLTSSSIQPVNVILTLYQLESHTLHATCSSHSFKTCTYHRRVPFGGMNEFVIIHSVVAGERQALLPRSLFYLRFCRFVPDPIFFITTIITAAAGLLWRRARK